MGGYPHPRTQVGNVGAHCHYCPGYFIAECEGERSQVGVASPSLANFGEVDTCHGYLDEHFSWASNRPLDFLQYQNLWPAAAMNADSFHRGCNYRSPS